MDKECNSNVTRASRKDVILDLECVLIMVVVFVWLERQK